MAGVCTILGILDLMAVLTLLALHFFDVPLRLSLAFALYLVFKLILFYQSWHSYIDAAIGVYMILLILGLSSTVTYVAAAYLLQKAIFSLVS